ncbi:PAS domain S-box protein [Synechococcus sp. RSCCF101]|uniref:sensor domain-containing protein n=1 Tax=Synechococcus sp. RSCCF101 TaxID=2511069 RepID=UPI001246719F|nr:PAS domain S-box protein [Synechococcus sp. RSCCF101]QEY31207.1 PAS domain S-box protein [Synechococcus sp. RSCCF101]
MQPKADLIPAGTGPPAATAGPVLAELLRNLDLLVLQLDAAGTVVWLSEPADADLARLGSGWLGAPLGRSWAASARRSLRQGLANAAVGVQSELLLRREELTDNSTAGSDDRQLLSLSLAPLPEGGSVGWIRGVDRLKASIRQADRLAYRYRMLAELGSDVIWQADAAGRLRWISPSIRRLSGHHPADLVGCALPDLVCPEDRHRLDRAWSDLERRERLSLELRLARQAGGEPVWVALSLRRVPDGPQLPDGEDGMVVGSLQDIGPEVEARQRERAIVDELIASEELFRLAMEHAPVGMALLGADGRVTAANQACCRLFARTEEELSGRHWLELSDDDDGDGERLLLDAVRHEDLEHYRLRRRLRCADGRAVWGDVSVSALREENGAIRCLIAQIVDITATLEAQEKLAAEEAHFRLLAENSSDVVVHLGQDQVIRWVSPSLEPCLGWAPGQWIGQPIETFLSGPVPSLRSNGTGKGHQLERLRVRGGDGSSHWMESTLRPYRNGGGADEGLIASLRLVDDKVRAEQELEHRARFDALTGLLNRSEMLERMGRQLHQRRRGSRVAVLFCDVDHFKSINDRHGHAVGDVVLQVTAQRIREAIRTNDWAARMGGDELVVVLNGLRDLADGTAIARKIRHGAMQPIACPGAGSEASVSVTLSIGLALASPGDSSDDVLARADRLLYEAKRQGRDRIVAAEPQESPLDGKLSPSAESGSPSRPGRSH